MLFRFKWTSLIIRVQKKARVIVAFMDGGAGLFNEQPFCGSGYSTVHRGSYTEQALGIEASVQQR